ncbi:hypothetical protein [Staphylococcus hominis]
MDKEVHVIFSDGDRHIYKEGYTKASEEFLKQNDINNHVIVTPEYLKEIERKAEAFDEVAVTVLSEDNDVIKNMNNIVTKIVINNLEGDHEG